MTGLVAIRLYAHYLATSRAQWAVSRLVCVMDMEYKGDEAWIFDRSLQAGRMEPLPA
jgi:hypothetical protein